MEFVKFSLSHEHYDIIECMGKKGIRYLADFLSDELGDASQYFKDWLWDSSSYATGGNYIYLRKIDDKIAIGVEWEDELPTEEQAPFETTKEVMHSILDRWQELVRKNAKEILITRDGDNVTVEGKF